ncbi:MAG: YtxH domain-containing protein [Muribaculaceae bacterium]|nr:YtxH domain-containing protein [Muribaculaceae bacterium]MDE6332007.1 YtxH domain-containing protein [Muribaculaceae bacterium]
MKTLNLVAAALGGALVGAAAALLLAPQSGSKTRDDITDFIKDRCPRLKKSKIEQLADQLEADIKEATK